jgi:UDP-N-acetylglucosamine--N-acetylmuramyl-(pentapeptide) pyrophosphoryl-undecaprenol N-acetylglucosamine transferase
MTKKIKELIPGFNNKGYQVLVITGKDYYDEYKDIKISKNVQIVPFMDNLINLLKDSDLIISRAGASTISEITAIGLPAILVPSPYVTNNHQYKNAKELSDNGACIIVSEDEFTKEIVLNKIDKLFDDKSFYDNMSKSSQKLGILDSATRIYQEAKKIIR